MAKLLSYCDTDTQEIISFSEEEYNYLNDVINGLIEMEKHIPKKFRTEKSILLNQIKEKYFT